MKLSILIATVCFTVVGQVHADKTEYDALTPKMNFIENGYQENVARFVDAHLSDLENREQSREKSIHITLSDKQSRDISYINLLTHFDYRFGVAVFQSVGRSGFLDIIFHNLEISADDYL